MPVHKIAAKITEMPGVNIPEERVFNQHGIKTTKQAYEVLSSAEQDLFAEIAESLGWKAPALSQFMSKCEMLLKVKGLATMNLMAVTAASTGAVSINTLSRRSPEGLLDDIQSAKDRGQLKIGKMPSLNEVSAWVDSAKKLMKPEPAKAS